MYFQNAGYPSPSRSFSFPEGEGAIWFSFVGVVQANIPPEYVWLRSTIIVDGDWSSSIPSVSPTLYMPGYVQLLFDFSIPTAPENQVKAGNQTFRVLPMSEYDIANQVGHIGFGTTSMDDPAVFTTTFRVLWEVSTDDVTYVPLSDFVAPSVFAYDDTLFAFEPSGGPPAAGCFWTDKLGVTEDC